MKCWPDDNDDDKPPRELPMWLDVLLWVFALTMFMVFVFNGLMGVLR